MEADNKPSQIGQGIIPAGSAEARTGERIEEDTSKADGGAEKNDAAKSIVNEQGIEAVALPSSTVTIKEEPLDPGEEDEQEESPDEEKQVEEHQAKRWNTATVPKSKDGVPDVIAGSVEKSTVVNVKQECPLPEDYTFYPMDFGMTVEEEEELRPVYKTMQRLREGQLKQGSSSHLGEMAGSGDSNSEIDDDEDEEEDDEEDYSDGEDEENYVHSDDERIEDNPAEDKVHAYSENDKADAYNQEQNTNLYNHYNKDDAYSAQDEAGVIIYDGKDNVNDYNEDQVNLYNEHEEAGVYTDEDKDNLYREGDVYSGDTSGDDMMPASESEDIAAKKMVVNSYECPLCTKQCGGRTNYMMHLRIKHPDELRYKCDICSAEFLTEVELETHTGAHDENLAFVCDICHKGFRTCPLLQMHMLAHDEFSRFLCEICQRSFGSQHDLYQHYAYHNNTGRPFECSECKAKFPVVHLLEQHRVMHRENTFTCFICSSDFPTMMSYMGHHQKAHALPRRYKCNICSKGFTTKKKLQIHEQVHSGKRPFVCDVCGLGYLAEHYLMKHRKMSGHVKSCTCYVCGKEFSDEGELMRHQADHEGEQKLPYSCSVCGLGFIKEGELSEHTKTHYIIRSQVPVCNICDMQFESKWQLRRHIQKEQHYIHPARSHPKKRYSSPRAKKKGKRFKCTICSQFFLKKRHLSNHKKVHMINKKYTCFVCCQEFGRSSHLKRHNETHHQTTKKKESFVCDICTLSCVNALHLENHRKVHSGCRLHICNLCGVAFNSSYNLVQHRDVTHALYRCKVCDKRFMSTKEVEVHYKERHLDCHFVCSTCGLSCVSEDHLRNHREIHTGTKSIFPCNFCGKVFVKRYSLIEHMETHTGRKPHQCATCHEGFDYSHQLLAHMQTVHTEHPGLVVGEACM